MDLYGPSNVPAALDEPSMSINIAKYSEVLHVGRTAFSDPHVIPAHVRKMRETTGDCCLKSTVSPCLEQILMTIAPTRGTPAIHASCEQSV